MFTNGSDPVGDVNMYSLFKLNAVLRSRRNLDSVCNQSVSPSLCQVFAVVKIFLLFRQPRVAQTDQFVSYFMKANYQKQTSLLAFVSS